MPPPKAACASRQATAVTTYGGDAARGSRNSRLRRRRRPGRTDASSAWRRRKSARRLDSFFGRQGNAADGAEGVSGCVLMVSPRRGAMLPGDGSPRARESNLKASAR